jgi:hypothetical protein
MMNASGAGCMIDRLGSLQFDKQLVFRQQVYRVRSDHPVTGGD